MANLEYRSRLFGNLHGAVFLDAGNVWNIGDDYDDVDLNNIFRDAGFKPSRLFSQMAVGTGVGLRYDLDFLILRLGGASVSTCPTRPATRDSTMWAASATTRRSTLPSAIRSDFFSVQFESY